ncbi:hypothetical protein G7K_5927-t1 [Saitoella complicata NRRL Y-17804]|uniref:Uncharacterized protein n=1 Tax=Saitoella complicata (strain BCRC 22490 / CBS 7301 / JCM 7358 / NBRC 10748 / NRRL Y-17804) TaxID=698492 RepID=A0A0E9NQ66_SAICN|nr:hypothetical protein G7K_5927-t1 [Saitoella complicata NRRL Y-17804]
MKSNRRNEWAESRERRVSAGPFTCPLVFSWEFRTYNGRAEHSNRKRRSREGIRDACKETRLTVAWDHACTWSIPNLSKLGPRLPSP